MHKSSLSFYFIDVHLSPLLFLILGWIVLLVLSYFLSLLFDSKFSQILFVFFSFSYLLSIGLPNLQNPLKIIEALLEAWLNVHSNAGLDIHHLLFQNNQKP